MKKISYEEHVDYVDQLTDSLTDAEYLHLVNGCGSQKFFLRLFRPRSKYCNLFSSACNWHDIGYYLGGTSQHRFIVDLEFYLRIMRKAWFSIFAQWAAFGMWRSVRRVGALCFEFRDEPATLAYLQAVAAATIERERADK